METDRPSHDSRVAMQKTAAPNTNGATSRIPWRLTVQTACVSFSLATTLLGLIPLRDLTTAGENYESTLALIGGASGGPLIVFVVNVVDQVLRSVRPTKTGIRPDWHFGLAIFAFLASLAAAILYCIPIGAEYSDKASIFLNEDADLCWNKETRERWSCKDGYWDREAQWIVLLVFSIILVALQGVMCFKFVREEWKVRRNAIKEQRRVENPA